MTAVTLQFCSTNQKAGHGCWRCYRVSVSKMVSNYKLKMENSNKNNPTQRWTEDEKYYFCKMENKWLKELPKNTSGSRKYGIVGAANDPEFSSIEEINRAFENDILEPKEKWKHLCHICDYATNNRGNRQQHLVVHGIGERFYSDMNPQGSYQVK